MLEPRLLIHGCSLSTGNGTTKKVRRLAIMCFWYHDQEAQ